MFSRLRRLFRKPHPATKRVIDDVEKRRLKAEGHNPMTEAEHVAHLGSFRDNYPGPIDHIELDDDTRARLHRKAAQAKPTPIWPVGCRHVVVSSLRPKPDMDRLADIFSPNPIPSVIAVSTVEDVECAYWRNVTVMVASLGTVDIILRLHKAGAHLIDPWGNPLDFAPEDEASRRGRDMADSARQREETVASQPAIDAAFLPDFHSCRYSEDPKDGDMGITTGSDL